MSTPTPVDMAGMHVVDLADRLDRYAADLDAEAESGGREVFEDVDGLVSEVMREAARRLRRGIVVGDGSNADRLRRRIAQATSELDAELARPTDG
jgi:hypothetical protein